MSSSQGISLLQSKYFGDLPRPGTWWVAVLFAFCVLEGRAHPQAAPAAAFAHR